MQTSSLENRLTPFDCLRWLFILPAAFLASWLVHGIGDFAFSTVGLDLRAPGYPKFLFPLQQLLPSGIAFVLAGAWMAPSRRAVAVIALVVLGFSSSWLIHVFAQSAPGLTNFMHAIGESLGLVIGAVIVCSLDGSPREQSQDANA